METWTPMPIDPVSRPPTAVPPPAPVQPATPAAGSSSFAAALKGAEPPAPPPPPVDEPPATALAAVQTAGRVYAQLRAADRELRFEQTDRGVAIEVYDGEGQLLQRVPATDVLRLAAGEHTWLA